MRPDTIREVVERITGQSLSRAAIGADHLAEGERVVAAMSGGVDSAVAAALLSGAGFEVVGVSMRLGKSQSRVDGHRGCCSLDDFDDARRAAEQLQLPHYVVDLRDVFQAQVIDPFVSSYAAGRTPNPCALCNRDVKFDALWDYADTLGARAVGTGHYARIARTGERFTLHAGADPAKDQSYFLFTLGQVELPRTLFPVGALPKTMVRDLAGALELPVADKPESQDICFVAGRRYEEFVEDELNARGEPMRGGPIRDQAGEEVGRHEGIHRFTVGQRRGLGGGATEPRFVTRIEPGTGTVVVGSRSDLERQGLFVEKAYWTDEVCTGPAEVRLRHRHARVPCTLHADGARIRIELAEATGGIAPGQAAVWYAGDRVLGGGWIASM